MPLQLARPRTPEEYEAAEQLEDLGLLTLNPDGSFTLTEKGRNAQGEFFDQVRAALLEGDSEGRGEP